MNIKHNIELAEKTTLKIGGPARYYAEPGNAEEIKHLLGWANENSLPVFMLGRGSNIVISDQGFSGLVISSRAAFNKIEWKGQQALCESGASLPALVSQAIEKGLGGIEKLGGIPGTVGGALIMNAAAFGQEIGSVVESVSYIDPADLKTKTLLGPALQFGYRWSSLQGRNVCVTAVTLRLRPENPASLKETYRHCNTQRKQKLPLDLPNCGSVFKNPTGQSAGALIEQCGLKGYECGGVRVSEKHANVIVNFNSGNAEDVRKLIGYIQKKVSDKFGIMPEPEVVFVGDF
ncbi:MAG: UDP-N-acetylmuramate dehydrogenase [Chitinivibrionales bacterium]|nr:UDP-N-acetylmuramate dehydrogenase [Chitinivibrionales bacterium]